MTRMLKKGDLTSKHIVIIVILIASFAVILFFWWQFSPNGETDLEVCRSSVLARGTVPVFKDTVSLKCKTRKVCISEKGCKDERIYDKIIRVQSRDELEMEVIKLMYDCWWMMGAGKVDYQRSGALENIYCAQCGIIDFDKSIKDKYEKITYLELLNEMRKNSIPNSEMNYMRYLYGTDSIEEFRGVMAKSLNEEIKLENNYIDLGQGQAIVTGIVKAGKVTTAGKWALIIGGVAVGAVGTLVMGPGGFAVAAIIIKVGVGAAAGGGVGYIVSPSNTERFISPMIIPYTSKALNAMKCKTFDTLI